LGDKTGDGREVRYGVARKCFENNIKFATPLNLSTAGDVFLPFE